MESSSFILWPFVRWGISPKQWASPPRNSEQFWLLLLSFVCCSFVFLLFFYVGFYLRISAVLTPWPIFVRLSLCSRIGIHIIILRTREKVSPQGCQVSPQPGTRYTTLISVRSARASAGLPCSLLGPLRHTAMQSHGVFNGRFWTLRTALGMFSEVP